MIAGDNDSRATYERLRTPAARLVVADYEDTVNTNITLPVREVAPDILQLSGATTALPLKRQLGESLANRGHRPVRGARDWFVPQRARRRAAGAGVYDLHKNDAWVSVGINTGCSRSSLRTGAANPSPRIRSS